MKFKQCPDCGAALDPCEKCDCQNEKKGAPAATGTPLGGNDWRRDSTFSLADPFQDVKNLLRLKEIREDTGAMAKDVAMIVRDHFPKFNRQLLSQCEHFDEYGVIIHPDGLKAICEACALATGYPKPFKEPDPVYCSECGKELVGTDTVFDYDGEALCANCCINRITDDYEVSEIAQALGIIAKKAEDFTEDDYE